MKRVVMAALLVALAAVCVNLAGCGGGGDDPGMVPPVQPPDCRGEPEVCR